MVIALRNRANTRRSWAAPSAPSCCSLNSKLPNALSGAPSSRSCHQLFGVFDEAAGLRRFSHCQRGHRRPLARGRDMPANPTFLGAHGLRGPKARSILGDRVSRNCSPVPIFDYRTTLGLAFIEVHVAPDPLRRKPRFDAEVCPVSTITRGWLRPRQSSHYAPPVPSWRPT